MTATRKVAALTTVLLLLGGCTEEVDNGAPQEAAQEGEREYDKQPPSPPANARLAAACEGAFALIENNEPGTVPRKKAVELANEAFFADDSPATNEAFSNLNNVYVFDDGTSSEAEVEAQLNEVCP